MEIPACISKHTHTHTPLIINNINFTLANSSLRFLLFMPQYVKVSIYSVSVLTVLISSGSMSPGCPKDNQDFVSSLSIAHHELLASHLRIQRKSPLLCTPPGHRHYFLHPTVSTGSVWKTSLLPPGMLCLGFLFLAAWVLNIVCAQVPPRCLLLFFLHRDPQLPMAGQRLCSSK